MELFKRTVTNNDYWLFLVFFGFYFDDRDDRMNRANISENSTVHMGSNKARTDSH